MGGVPPGRAAHASSLAYARPVRRFYPYDPMTGDIDTAAASADGKTYSNPKYMTTIVSGGAGNREDESKYVKTAESATGGEMEEAAEAAVNRAHSPLPARTHRVFLFARLFLFPSSRPSHLPSFPVENYGWGIFQAQNATHATWFWHTSVVNKGPAGWADSLTIIQTGRGH